MEQSLGVMNKYNKMFGLTLVDVGGTKEKILVVGVDDGGLIHTEVILAEARVPTPARNLPEGDVNHFYDETAKTIKMVQYNARKKKVGVLPLVCVGAPGRLVGGRIASGTAGNLGSSFDGLSHEKEFRKRLNQDVWVINDAVAQMGAGLYNLLKKPGAAEKLRGQRVCYVGPGTGLGGGFCKVGEDLLLEYYTDGHIYDMLIPGYTGNITYEFTLSGELHTINLDVRFAEDVLSGRATRQIACAIDRYLIGRGIQPLFLPLVDDVEGMSEPEKKMVLDHQNNKSPVSAELINKKIFGRKKLGGKKSRAYSTAKEIAVFQGQMLGRLIECIHKGNIKKSTKNAQWPKEDVKRVAGTKNYLIGGNLGTKGEMGRIIRKEAFKYLKSRFRETEFNLFVLRESESMGAYGIAVFLEKEKILNAINNLG